MNRCLHNFVRGAAGLMLALSIASGAFASAALQVGDVVAAEASHQSAWQRYEKAMGELVRARSAALKVAQASAEYLDAVKQV